MTIPCGGDDHEAIVAHIVTELALFAPERFEEQRLH